MCSCATSSASAAIRSAKAQLRREIKKKVAALTDVEKEQQSKVVLEKLLSLPQVQSSTRICMYLSMSDEVRTVPLLKTLLARKTQVFVPQYIGPDMKMVQVSSWEDYEDFPETKWKIKQPADDDSREDALSTGGLDLIVMPGLGFTDNGGRLGRGKGYYDKYLTRCREAGCQPFTVGLAFNEQIFDIVPMDATDIPLNMVLYPNKK